jgi:plasmid segregation protein ParM
VHFNGRRIWNFSEQPMANSSPTRTARALDLGYGFTKYTRGHHRPGGNIDVGCFPSFAALTPKQPSLDSAANLSSMNIVHVNVDGAIYAVGQDAKAAGTGQARQLLDSSYFTSPQYLALARGAMSFMQTGDRIDVLTTGLPLNVFGDKNLRAEVEHRLLGAHELPNADGTTRRIVVGRVDVIPQVVGSLFALALASDNVRKISNERNLTIDVGYGTLLWLMTEGLKPIPSRSNGNMGGVSSLLQSVVRAIDPAAASNVGILERVDKALRPDATRSIKINGVEVELDKHLMHLTSTATENLAELIRSVGSPSDIDNVFLTGGGAHLYRNLVAKAFAGRDIIEDPVESQFTNVRGYQLLSERTLGEL